MKKIILILMFLLSITIFAEKLTTDGKYHFDKIMGYWEIPDADFVILKKGNQYYMELPIDTFIDKPVLIHPVKDGIFKVPVDNEFWYFAYDIKHKVLVMIDKNSNILAYLKKYK